MTASTPEPRRPTSRRASRALVVAVLLASTGALSGCDAEITAVVEPDLVRVDGVAWPGGGLPEQPCTRVENVAGTYPGAGSKMVLTTVPVTDAARPGEQGCRFHLEVPPEEARGLQSLGDRWLLSVSDVTLTMAVQDDGDPEDAIHATVTFPGAVLEASEGWRIDGRTATFDDPSASFEHGVRILAQAAEPGLPWPARLGLAGAAGAVIGGALGAAGLGVQRLRRGRR